MGNIYKITNKCNNKSYIGKTEFPIHKRWLQHIRDSKKDRCKHRPLYRAMNKYGVDNFELDLIEVTENTEIREIFWINHYQTYSSGYNATKGGDGKCFVDHLKILELHSSGLPNIMIVSETGYDISTVKHYLNKFLRTENTNIHRFPMSRNVKCLETSQVFDSQHAAARHISTEILDSKISSVANKISLCCRGIRKTAYGYTWEYI